MGLFALSSRNVLRLVLALTIGTSLASCESRESEAIADSRAAIRAKLRDPASAEFRNEKIQTLWSTNGDRMTLYCAEVNGRNGFGGMAGFKLVHRVVAVAGDRRFGTNVEDVFIDDEMNSTYYMRCVRDDTQRADGAVFAAYGSWWIGDATGRGLDTSEPKLSDTKVDWASE